MDILPYRPVKAKPFRVKRVRFTLFPALGAGFRHLVEGETCFKKAPVEVEF
jgi:hypothetical protein